MPDISTARAIARNLGADLSQPRLRALHKQLTEYLRTGAGGLVEGSAEWGNIAGLLSDQSDLLNELRLGFVTVTATSYTAIVADDVILVDDDTAGGVVTVDLPAAAADQGKPKYIKKLGSTANVTIDADGSETVDGSLTRALTAQYETVCIVSDGAEWWVL